MFEYFRCGAKTKNGKGPRCRKTVHGEETFCHLHKKSKGKLLTILSYAKKRESETESIRENTKERGRGGKGEGLLENKSELDRYNKARCCTDWAAYLGRAELWISTTYNLACWCAICIVALTAIPTAYGLAARAHYIHNTCVCSNGDATAVIL